MRATTMASMAALLSAACSHPAPVAEPPPAPPAPVVQAPPVVEASPEPAPVEAPPPAPTRWDQFVPAFDVETTAHVRAVFTRGAAAGLRADVFSKLGDSITESGSFAQDIGHGWYELGPFADLEPVIRWFRRRDLQGREDNSFAHASVSATAGWEASQLLEGGDRCPVERELQANRGAFAVLMVGTNDAERSNPATYATRLGEILDRIERRNVVAIVSTIPSHRGSDAAHAAGLAINERIRAAAAARHLPLIDYHAALAAVPSEGVSDDNVHPSVFVDHGDTRAAVFTADGLRYGYNVRNLLLLMALRRTLDAAGVRYAGRSR